MLFSGTSVHDHIKKIQYSSPFFLWSQISPLSTELLLLQDIYFLHLSNKIHYVPLRSQIFLLKRVMSVRKQVILMPHILTSICPLT